MYPYFMPQVVPRNHKITSRDHNYIFKIMLFCMYVNQNTDSSANVTYLGCIIYTHRKNTLPICASFNVTLEEYKIPAHHSRRAVGFTENIAWLWKLVQSQ